LTLQLIAILAYSAALVAVGLVVGRRVEKAATFFVADRKLGSGLVFSTMLAANIGAGSIIGASGLGYRTGWAAWWWVGSAGIGSLLLAFWLGPRIWRVAAEHGLYTAGDYLELRYGSAVRATVATILWFLTLVILAAQLIAMSEIFEWVLGVPRWVGAALGGAVMTAYFAAGGLLTSAWVNALQLVVLLGGFAIGVPIALARAGGMDALLAASPQQSVSTFLWTPGAGLVLVALLVPAFIISPGLIQKAYGARDERAVRVGIGLNGLVLLLFALAPPLLGMIARRYDPSLANPEFAVPLVLTEGLSPLLGALGLAAVFSAEVSTADAILFMLATSLSKDIYKRYWAPDADDARVLRVARQAAFLGGTLGILLAIVIPTVIDSLRVFYAVLGVSLFVPIAAGLHTRRTGVPEALAAIGVGIVVLLSMLLTRAGGGSPLADPTLWGITASGVAYVATFWLRSVVLGRRLS
jgi:SSS family solute:Na+ symporter